MKFFFALFFLFTPINLNSQTILADLTCEGEFSCFNCKPIIKDSPLKGRFILGNYPSMMVKDLVFIQGIPIFNGFIVNDNPETTNVLEFGDYESNSKSGEINRITGQIILVDIETMNDDGGWTSNALYIGNCKKTEKLF